MNDDEEESAQGEEGHLSIKKRKYCQGGRFTHA